MHICFLLLSHYLPTVPKCEQDHGHHNRGVVLDLGAGVGWFEGSLVSNFGELGGCHPVGIDEVGSGGTVGVVFVETVVEAHGPAVISLPYCLHQLITFIFITHTTSTITITVILFWLVRKGRMDESL